MRMVGSGESSVVLRWEWRIFGSDLPLSSDRLSEAVSGPQRRSAECYLLSTASPHNVKIRDGAVEVKRLEEVHPSGLERWRPTLRAPFPLDPALLAEVWDALKIPPPIPPIALEDETRFLQTLPEGVRPVRLEKRRRPLLLRGCPGEWVLLGVGDVEQESLALEHPDPEFLLEILRWLRLDPAANTNYPRALTRLARGPAPTLISGA